MIVPFVGAWFFVPNLRILLPYTLEKSPSLSGFPAIIAGYEPVFLAKNYENIEFPHKGCK